MRAALITRRTTLIAALVAVATAALLVLQASTAAFTDTTDNTGNFFNADAITLTDNDADNVMYEVDDMLPGDVEERCITVSYTGANDATVNLYAAIGGLDGLAEYLDITIDADTSPSATTTSGDFDCPVGFDGDTTAQATTKLDSFVASANDFATGVGNIVVEDNDDVVYRFVVEFDENAPDLNDAQGESVTDLDFTWEAQTN